MLEIDGSMGEGGGQVLRTALSLSCILQQPVRITNIRAGRPKPGLAAQHLTVCKLLSEICGAQMQGATLGSTTLEFSPGKISGGDYKFDIGTAGSITLLLQAALPVLAHAEPQINYSIISSMLPPHVLVREEDEVKKAFPGCKGMAHAVDAACAGNALTLWSGAHGASALGVMGKPAEKVAQGACVELARDMAAATQHGAGASVDAHLADQLLIYAALARGRTEFSAPALSSHLNTNADVIRAMTGRNIRLGSDRSITVE